MEMERSTKPYSCRRHGAGVPISWHKQSTGRKFKMYPRCHICLREREVGRVKSRGGTYRSHLNETDGLYYCRKHGPLEPFWLSRRDGTRGKPRCRVCLRATCHPERRIHLHGLCRACFYKKNPQQRVKDVAASKVWRDNNKGRHKAMIFVARLKKQYGITTDQYHAMLAAQGGLCAICDKPQNQLKRRMNVDHDHACCPGFGSCGKCIRGLLCSSCNTLLGRIESNLNRIKLIFEYIGYSIAMKRKPAKAA
jgi:hypothetical protein